MEIEIKGRCVLIDEEDLSIVNEKSWTYAEGDRPVTGFRQDGKHHTWSMGRYILAHHFDLPEKLVVCYKNKDTLDNRKENLEIKTKRENRLEAKEPKSRKPQSSKRPGCVKGVYARCGAYEVILRIDKKVTYCGRYKRIAQANEAAIQIIDKQQQQQQGSRNACRSLL